MNTKQAKQAGRTGRPVKENIYLKDKYQNYLQNKNLAPSTIEHYIWDLGIFLAWVGKEEIEIAKSDILKYLEHLKNDRNLKNISRSSALNCANHYFTFLHKQEQITTNPCAFLKIRGTQQKTLYRIYTPEELTALYDKFYLLYVLNYDDSHIPKNQRKQSFLSKSRNAVILNILVYQGVTTTEICKIQLQDLDLTKATLKIHGGKKGKDRTLSLQATQIGVLMDYLQNIRPQFLEYHTADSNKLFLPMPEFSKHRTNTETVKQSFKLLTNNVKSIDTNFLNFNQVRASVITNWLKVHGLRKTQIMAGHRSIGSTEKYVANQMEGLINDITQYNPF
jgi:integrase/recombinase XerD